MKRKQDINYWLSLSNRLAYGTALGLTAALTANAQSAADSSAPKTETVAAADTTASPIVVAQTGTAAPAASPATAKDVQQTEAIVITGSRITRRDYSSPSPIVTAPKEMIQDSGNVTLEATLNQMPQFVPAGGAGTVSQGTGARATLDLRGLGDIRNLILLDGRRLPLSSPFAQVDINSIPQTIVDSVEIISGGASATYGSDAMSGVVNFKSARKLKGVVLDLQYGDSEKNDYRKSTASLTAGTEFDGGKGYALFSAGWDERQNLPGLKREFFRDGIPSGFIGTGVYTPSANNLPTQVALNALFQGYGISTVVPPSNSLGFNNNGTLFSQTGATNYLGPNGVFAPEPYYYKVISGNVRMPTMNQSDLLHGMRRDNFFNKVEYKFTPDVTGYAQLLYSDSVVHTNTGGSLTQFGLGANTTIPLSNPFIPADLRTILASRPNATAPFLWTARFVGFPAKQWDEKYSTTQFLAGLKGNMPIKDWTWDAYLSIDKTDHTQTLFNAILSSRVFELLNATNGGTGICAGGFNPFGITNASTISDACRAYMSTTAISKEELEQRIAEGSINGSLFTLPAGEVQFSASVNYRKNTYLYLPDSQLAAQNIEAVIASQRSQGETTVKEAALELRVPILENASFAKSLAVNLGYRFSDYNVSGSTNTYKAELEWTPVKNWLVRGGYQHAIRAPNIGELYSAEIGGQQQFGSPPNGGEPCDVRTVARTGPNGAQVRTLCIATGVPASVVDNYTFPTVATSTLSSGNPNLKPETANTNTIGLVFTPQFADPLFSQLSASVDYYNIKIDDTISPVPAGQALNKCYNLDGSNPTYSAANVFCQLLKRDSNGLLTQIAAPYLNLGQLKTSGVDVTIDWRFKLGAVGLSDSYGTFGITSLINFLNSYQSQALPGDPIREFAGTVDQVIRPKWQMVNTFRYDLGAGSVSLRWRHIPAMDDVTVVTRPASPFPGVEKYDIFDLTGRYNLSKNTELRAGITNLFNVDPALVPGNQNLTLSNTYDIVGRSYYVGMRMKF